MWVWILVGIALLVILFYRPRENMTNEQLIDTLKTFGEQNDSSSSSNTFGQSIKPIYGPSANPPPIPTNKGAGGKTVAGPYPEIFGPDVTNAPGTSGYGGRRGSFGGGAGGGAVGGAGGGAGGAGGAGSAGGAGGAGGARGGGAANGYVFSDQPGPADRTYEFNPDLARTFPVDGPPQPFLTDFSNIQH
uniref:Uncharacterized protein n=1 Tax=viral metagenome TaxID=1070528 RepID=A0A6C0DQI9_9ZZZZ